MTIYEEQLVKNSIGRNYWIYKNDLFYQQRIADSGPYQKQNLIRLRTLVPNARTILDVGMNIGMNTIEYATWAKAVHGFEPTPQTYHMATRNIKLAQTQTTDFSTRGWWPDITRLHGWASCMLQADVHTHNCGLGDIEGECEMVIKKNNAGSNYMENIHVPLPNGSARLRRMKPEKITVKVKTIDQLGLTDVDIIKVDTEGYEFPVIKGAERTIMQYKPVVQLEMMERQQSMYGFNCQIIYDWFLARGFVATLSDGSFAGENYVHVPKKVERFFIHKSHIT